MNIKWIILGLKIFLVLAFVAVAKLMIDLSPDKQRDILDNINYIQCTETRPILECQYYLESLKRKLR